MMCPDQMGATKYGVTPSGGSQQWGGERIHPRPWWRVGNKGETVCNKAGTGGGVRRYGNVRNSFLVR